ncbi:hypothetical protein [Ferruginibacter sp.]|nr:hypothetical protein [Ferruginibacter sp.]
MKNLSEIEQTVSQLPDDDFAKFRQWFWEYETEKWDARIEKDIAHKKLDGLANKALDDFNNGKYKSL